MCAALDRRRAAGTLRVVDSDGDAGGSLVDFASNDYLGLARDAGIYAGALRAELAALDDAAAVPRQLSGSTGARLLSGASAGVHGAFEAYLAAFHGGAAALLFVSGYAANCGVLSTIADVGDTLLFDELSHNSTRFGFQRGRQREAKPFPHNDADAVRRLVADVRAREHDLGAARGTVFISVESVYSMDGDEAPLDALADVCLEDGAACLVVDEAHATGVVGAQGRGAVSLLSEAKQRTVVARIHTFGKAVGCGGAAVIGSEALRSYLANYAQPFIYSTSPAPHASRLAKRCYDEMRSESGDARREKLHGLVSLFRVELADAGEALIPSSSAIQVRLCGTRRGRRLGHRATGCRHLRGEAVRPRREPRPKRRFRRPRDPRADGAGRLGAPPHHHPRAQHARASLRRRRRDTRRAPQRRDRRRPGVAGRRPQGVNQPRGVNLTISKSG